MFTCDNVQDANREMTLYVIYSRQNSIDPFIDLGNFAHYINGLTQYEYLESISERISQK